MSSGKLKTIKFLTDFRARYVSRYRLILKLACSKVKIYFCPKVNTKDLEISVEMGMNNSTIITEYPLHDVKKDRRVDMWSLRSTDISVIRRNVRARKKMEPRSLVVFRLVTSFALSPGTLGLAKHTKEAAAWKGWENSRVKNPWALIHWEQYGMVFTQRSTTARIKTFPATANGNKTVMIAGVDKRTL